MVPGSCASEARRESTWPRTRSTASSSKRGSTSAWRRSATAASRFSVSIEAEITTLSS
jgi:hypothetical protein